MSVREVRPADVPAVVGLVHELADYEREPARCQLTADQLQRRPVRRPAGAVRPRRRGRRGGRRLRAVVPQLLHLARRARHLPRGPLRPAGPPRARPGPGAAGHAGRHLRRPRLRRGSSGRCWTGTSRRSASTARSARSGWTSGRPSGWTGRPWTAGRRRQRPAGRTAAERPDSGSQVHRPHPGPLADQQQERGQHVRPRRARRAAAAGTGRAASRRPAAATVGSRSRACGPTGGRGAGPRPTASTAAPDDAGRSRSRRAARRSAHPAASARTRMATATPTPASPCSPTSAPASRTCGGGPPTCSSRSFTRPRIGQWSRSRSGTLPAGRSRFLTGDDQPVVRRVIG